MFYTPYNKPETAATPAGEKLQETYEMEIDENGHKVLTRSPIKENIYEKIQESLEETKIENILRRAVGGDETALNVTQGAYFDATGSPTSLAEAQKMIIAITEEFYKLPLEVREKFDHSPEKYVHEYGSESWVAAMSKPESEKVPEEKVKPDE